MGLLTEIVPAGAHLRARAGGRRGARALSPGDDARRPARGPRRIRPSSRRGTGAGSAGGARASTPPPSRAPGASPRARAAAGPGRACRVRPGPEQESEEESHDVLRDGCDRIHRTPSHRAAAGARGRHPCARARGLAASAWTSLVSRWGAEDRVRPVLGDLQEPRLGVSDDARRRARGRRRALLPPRGRLRHDRWRGAQRAPQRRRHAQRRRARQRTPGRPSAPRLLDRRGGRLQGLFREDLFDEGQKLPSAYHRTKFESEKIAREESAVPWRVYRPAVVVGHSQTGEMDKIDGPYYFFKAIQRLRHWLPEWVPLVGPELGYTNVVPVDFVAAAMDHIAHQPGLDGRAFHLTNPHSQRVGEVMNAFARRRPRAAAGRAGGQAASRRAAQGRPRDRPEAASAQRRSDARCSPTSASPRRSSSTSRCSPSSIRATPSARWRDRASRSRALEDYADKLWDFWERRLDPDLYKDRSFEARGQRDAPLSSPAPRAASVAPPR